MFYKKVGFIVLWSIMKVKRPKNTYPFLVDVLKITPASLKVDV